MKNPREQTLKISERGIVGPMDRFAREFEGLRKEKDEFFRTDLDSPIPPEQRSKFKGLNYFPAEEDYRVAGLMESFDEPQPVFIATSTGSRQSYLKYGVVRFEIASTKLHLVVYKSAEDPFARSLFIPFSDETSGRETYQAGRYLDIEEHGRDEYEIDFNMAYNPYCAYNDLYTCPIAPRENRLPIRILAGEKNYK
jgi:uncharacterized protein (DUF1684 family)